MPSALARSESPPEKRACAEHKGKAMGEKKKNETAFLSSCSQTSKKFTRGAFTKKKCCARNQERETISGEREKGLQKTENAAKKGHDFRDENANPSL